MLNYTHILVATDFSDINLQAVRRAADIARDAGARLSIIHVLEHFPVDGPLASAFGSSKPPSEALITEIKRQMRELMETLELPEAQPIIRISVKSARSEILDYTREAGVDLIVVAPHGKGFIGNLGSTAMGVISGATCDVLTVRGPAS